MGMYKTAVLVLAVLGLGGYLTRDTWLGWGAESLVCKASEAPSDAILIEHVENSYLLFEWARQLQARGLSSTVLVPILVSRQVDRPQAVSIGLVEVMCRAAGIPRCTTFEAPLAEPISLNLARRSAEELRVRGVHSVLLVTGEFRSRRALLIYSKILQPRGIQVHCQPVVGSQNPETWRDTAHGVQEVALQLAKLWYYRLLVIPWQG